MLAVKVQTGKSKAEVAPCQKICCTTQKFGELLLFVKGSALHSKGTMNSESFLKYSVLSVPFLSVERGLVFSYVSRFEEGALTYLQARV